MSPDEPYPHESVAAGRYHQMGWDPEHNGQGLGSGDYTMGLPGSREPWEFKSVFSPNPLSIARAAARADGRAYRALRMGLQPVTRLVLDATPGGHSTAAAIEGFDRYIQTQVTKRAETRITEAHLWGVDKQQRPELSRVSPTQIQQRVSELEQGQKALDRPPVAPPRSTLGGGSPQVPGSPGPGYAFSPGPAGHDSLQESEDSSAEAGYDFKPPPRTPEIGRGSR